MDTMKKSIADWNYYSDSSQIKSNSTLKKGKLDKLNSIINSEKMKEDFINLIKEDPSVLEVIPILLASRDTTIFIDDDKNGIEFDFLNFKNKLDEYATFMEKSGLFNFFKENNINNLNDYVAGVEVGLSSNARKNRSGKKMEAIVEKHLIQASLLKDKDYFCQISSKNMAKMFNLKNIETIKEKTFDFVVQYNNQIYAIECNYYNTQGSKVSEIVRSYKSVVNNFKEIERFHFLWITDGLGWKKQKNNLADALDSIVNIFNISDLENKGIIGIIKEIK
ncbi:Type II restriction modification system endonuclease [Metamycoplasma auris 15026]|uniref:Type-2 restriction enzyme n=2 Tax=Metamycoplasma auris TaxID=51363 RepID=N9TRT8_9BACT|nr:Type II restriction modification system endonuclease [Metamycoplasma auris 15026]